MGGIKCQLVRESRLYLKAKADISGCKDGRERAEMVRVVGDIDALFELYDQGLIDPREELAKRSGEVVESEVKEVCGG